MSGASSRRKGASFERQIAAWFRDDLGLETCRRLKQYAVAGEPDLDPVAGFAIECKAHAKLSVPAWWKQAVVQAKKADLEPLGFYRVLRKGWRAVLPNPVSWATGAAWGYDLEFTREVSPAALALIVRERIG